MGTPAAAVPSLSRLIEDGHEVAAVYTQPDRPAGRGNKIAFSPVKECAMSRGIKLIQPQTIRTAEALEEFRSHNADVTVVVAYGRILPDAFLNAFPKGAVNLHFSLLPKYRGAAPVNWAIVNGETETGVTTMLMDAGLDTGAILLQRPVEIGETESSVQLMPRLSEIGAEVLSDTLARLDELVAQPQDNAAATYAPIMKREDGRIDWQLSAKEISQRVRGFQPFPGSYTFLEGKKVAIWKAAAAAGESTGQAGQAIMAEGDDLIVECGDGTHLRIEELQPEGKRRMSPADFLNGLQLNKVQFRFQ